jgi:triacylglycerol lipase
MKQETAGMYYPKNFDRTRAIQLGGLVKQAYEQLEAFQNDKTWNLQGNYSRISELRYLGIPTSPAKAADVQFDKELRKFAKSKLQRGKGLPIGFIAENAADVFLIFRGTVTTSEWLRDLNIHLTSYPYLDSCKVHEGFLLSYNVFRQSIHSSLATLDKRKHLFIAGHSLGAALATLAISDLAASTGFKSPIVYTYASPRVGDKAFAQAYNRIYSKSSFRITNTSDLVVSIPLPVPFLGFIGGYFTHVETPIDFTIQEEDLEKNHVIGTYLSALREDRDRKGFLRNLFK